jgi:hypothetical protein
MSAIPFTSDGLIEVSTTRHSEESADAEWQRVLDGVTGLSADDRAVALSGRAVSTAAGPHLTAIVVNDAVRAVALQGGWWYRGVWSVTTDSQGTSVTYTVVNVAPGLGRWVAHLFHAPHHRRKILRNKA